MKKYSIVVHGGAGEWDGNSDKKKQKLEEACKLGENMLKNGFSSIDVVEKVVNFLEDEPIFNAGCGSTLTINGDVEMDASIMRGNSELYSRCGAVAGIKNIKNPISVARKVMEETPHILLISHGANDFAKLMGFTETNTLKTKHREEERIKLIKEIEENNSKLNSKLLELIRKYPELLYGTVGAVVFDGKEIVVGTSTGGIPLKIFGRVGDSALIGCGTYASPKCGVSCTGTGEIAIEFSIAKEICSQYENNENLELVNRKLINCIKEKFPQKGTAFISIDYKGIINCQSIKEFGYAFATEKEGTKFEKIKS
ncbi:MAG: isoaspartyl peptidase/L-asparaginase [Nanoarchaeota archaeon]|nr:isoaspartyl peptidase/L-asparaginase [Nanoarchaeota archaeon]